MRSVLIVYASSTGNTEKVANLIGDNLDYNVKVISVVEVKLNEIKDADLVLFGSSTWGYGNLQEDFKGFIEQFSKELLGGKEIAVFGCGDKENFNDVFCNATDEIREKAERCGAVIVAENLRVNGEPDDNIEQIIEFALQF